MGKRKQYEVIRDTREQRGWDFPVDEHCQGMVEAVLPTGDYTLRNYEHLFVIERKATTAELAGNIFEERFEDELRRLEDFRHPFILCQFDIYDVMQFPINSTIPRNKWEKLRVTSKLMLKRINEIQIQYRIPFIFGGIYARDVAISLFRRVIDKYAS